MDYTNWDAYDLLEALEMSGERPAPELVEHILSRGEEVTPGLIDMLTRGTQQHWDAEDPRGYRDAHAGMLLIGLREEKALPVFEAVLRDPEREQLVEEWFETWLPDYGPAIVPYLIRVAEDDDVFADGRDRAVRLLGIVGMNHPEARAEILPVLHDLLPTQRADGSLDVPEDYEEISEEQIDRWSWAAAALADLRDADALDRVEELFQADLLDEHITGTPDEYREALAMEWPEAGPAEGQDVLDYYRKLDEWSGLSDEELAEAVQAELLGAGLDPDEAASLRGDMMEMFGRNLADEESDDVGMEMLQRMLQQLRDAGLSEKDIDRALQEAVSDAMGEDGGEAGDVQGLLDLIKSGAGAGAATPPPPVVPLVHTTPQYGRNDRVTIRDPETGATETLKYKHAQRKLDAGWELAADDAS